MDITLYKQRKKALGLTFDDLAKMTKVSKRTLIELFNNTRTNPTNNTIKAIEQALGIGWTDEELAQGVLPTVVRNLDGDEDELLEAYRELGIKKGKSAQELIQKIIIEMCDL